MPPASDGAVRPVLTLHILQKVFLGGFFECSLSPWDMAAGALSSRKQAAGY